LPGRGLKRWEGVDPAKEGNRNRKMDFEKE